MHTKQKKNNIYNFFTIKSLLSLFLFSGAGSHTITQNVAIVGGGSSLLGSTSSSSGSLASRLSLPLPLTACHRCDVCGKLLSTKLTLKRHKEQQHLQPLNNAVCNLCHKVFRTLNSLNNHKSIYHRRQKHHHFGGGGGGGVGIVGSGHHHQGPHHGHPGLHSPISPTQSNNPHKIDFM